MRSLALSALLALSAALAAGATPVQAAPTDCPGEGGTVRMGVEPYEAQTRLSPTYDALAKAIGDKLGCKVQVFITTSYNAEIEAMRNDKLDVAEFGPLGYVLAHQVAKADVFATFSDARGKPSTYYASIVTWPGSGITSIKGVAGHTFAYSDPDSTSGHLFPAFGLKKAGIDPDHGVKSLYAGSHTASFEAIRNHKVEAGELNSVLITAAQQAGTYSPDQFITLWKSDDIPNDPIAVRRSLPDAFKKRLIAAVMSVDFASLPAELTKVFPAKGTTKFVAQTDPSYNVVRDLVSTLNIDLSKL
ncbi:MAG TPA: phosphate/phosphite/phosphonate ABC transporter substrate-binding protein [Candidatus Elarobacter sp.]|jgi:phosphonate transport system substrate-binding protein|nr:phosphate/phosphite/phosphonate ABC transporter substrate-binding protein [Candidatus Elarobacter sp.]